MANKVIRFSKSDVQQRTETNPNEVYKDLSMIAKQASKTVNANKQSQILFSANKNTGQHEIKFSTWFSTA